MNTTNLFNLVREVAVPNKTFQSWEWAGSDMSLTTGCSGRGTQPPRLTPSVRRPTARVAGSVLKVISYEAILARTIWGRAKE